MKTFILPRRSLRCIHEDSQGIIEDIWLAVHRYGGEFAIQRSYIEFYVPEDSSLFIKLMYPFLIEV